MVGVISQSEATETTESWRLQYKKNLVMFSSDRQSEEISSVLYTQITVYPIQEKCRRVSVHFKEKVGEEIQKFVQEFFIVKLNKCTREHFISSIVITAKKDGSVKLAMHAKPTIEKNL